MEVCPNEREEEYNVLDKEIVYNAKDLDLLEFLKLVLVATFLDSLLEDLT